MNNLVLIVSSFIAIWVGAGVVVRQVEVLARRIRISRFIVSFFLLGFATSVSEFSVAINSLIYGRPQISVGNLTGGAMFILLFIIPLVALLGGGLPLRDKLSGRTLTLFVITVATPLVVLLDGVLSVTEGLTLILIYFFYLIAGNGHPVSSSFLEQNAKNQFKNVLTLLKILGGIAVVFVASKIIVERVIDLSSELQISAFFLSAVLVSLGTNIPELSIAARSIFDRKADIALGDYMGSATVNTLSLGVLSIFYRQDIVISDVATMMLVIFIVGVLVFYRACLSGKKITRDEAFILIILYMSFILIEGAREYLL